VTTGGEGAAEETLHGEGGSAGDDADDARASGERSGRRRLSFGIVGQTAVVVGLIGGVVGLVFTFFPGLRPSSGGGAKPAADVAIASVNPKATLREYLNAERISAGGLSPAVLGRLGVLATIHYTSSGLGDKELPLVVSLTSSESGKVVCEHTYRIDAGSGEPLTVRSWSPFPATPGAEPGSYDLHVTLFRPDGQPPGLDAADENDIPGVSVAGPRLPLDLC
jgi:hypothetical protein